LIGLHVWPDQFPGGKLLTGHPQGITISAYQWMVKRYELEYSA